MHHPEKQEPPQTMPEALPNRFGKAWRARFPCAGSGLFSKRANVGGAPEFLQDLPHLVEGVRLLSPRQESGHAPPFGHTSCSTVLTMLRPPSAIVRDEWR